ncbi:MAG TPA: deoxyribodipyrimidine photo-lyase [Terrimicrobiaceae bacterium]|nr:deoxyribodipyrimidine photo-lyase [Terrimicrobiaceae bacterium]
MDTAIVWFRRDLRITDNTALAIAVNRWANVVPVYILSDWRGKHHWTGPNRQRFLCGCIASLAQNLEAIGGRLVIRQGEAVKELAKLARETGAQAVCLNRDPDPFGRRVETDLHEFGGANGVEIVACKDISLHERDEVLTSAGEPFRVFTPYARAWAKLEKTEATGAIRKLRTEGPVSSLPLPTLETWGLSAESKELQAGEKAARDRMKRFLERGLARYSTGRNALGEPLTSRLSQDLRFGLISIRELFSKCREREAELSASGRKGAQKFIGELIWREFYLAILWHFPEVLEVEFNPKFRGMKWRGNSKHFERWCAGETGFPIVDAAMRQLAQTGFMPNRARMIVAMFLTKDLLVDWRLGEGHFMQKLTDGEIASNNGGWQWSAGTGADAAPYFRILNPWTQSARFDPNGDYIKTWIPELRDVAPGRFAEQPPPGERLSKRYPAPIVDHAQARNRALEVFGQYKAKSD